MEVNHSCFEVSIHSDTFFRTLAGRDLISLKEDYGKYDGNTERESQIKSQLRPKNCGLTWMEDEHSDGSINELHKDELCNDDLYDSCLHSNIPASQHLCS